jgi:hypothetical protein
MESRWITPTSSARTRTQNGTERFNRKSHSGAVETRLTARSGRRSVNAPITAAMRVAWPNPCPVM